MLHICKSNPLLRNIWVVFILSYYEHSCYGNSNASLFVDIWIFLCVHVSKKEMTNGRDIFSLETADDLLQKGK